MAAEKVVNISDKKALKLLEGEKTKAEEVLSNADKFERLLQRLEKKLKKVPVAGTDLASVPVLVSLLKAYVCKEYTDLPIASIVAILAAIIYFVSPVDFIPDALPVVGLIDDAAVVKMALTLVQTDVDEYLEWREANGKNVV